MYKYEIELLDTLFYNGSMDSGAAGATVTYEWIGDIALSYSIVNSLGLNKNTTFKYNSHTPDYSEITDFKFITSIAISENIVQKTQLYDFAASFISDGYYPASIFDKINRSPFRNWIKRQGLLPGNKFFFYLVTIDNLVLPDKFTVRLGNMKSTIAAVKRIEESNKDLIWINLFTLKLLNIESNLNPEDIDFISDEYIIQKWVDPKKWEAMIKNKRG